MYAAFPFEGRRLDGSQMVLGGGLMLRLEGIRAQQIEKLKTVLDPGLLIDVVEMLLNGARRDEEAFRYCVVAQSFKDTRHNFKLAPADAEMLAKVRGRRVVGDVLRPLQALPCMQRG